MNDGRTSDLAATASPIDRRHLQETLATARALVVLRGVLDDDVGCAMLQLLDALAAATPVAQEVGAAYVATFRTLAAAADHEPIRDLADAWQAHLTARVLDDVNAWSLQAEAGGSVGVAPGVKAQARCDLAALRRLFGLEAEALLSATHAMVLPTYPNLSGSWTAWRDLCSPTAVDTGDTARQRLRLALATAPDWAALMPDLEAHWSRHGSGAIARFRMLRWDGQAGGLVGISHPDPVRLDQLFGYEREHDILCRNLERFLAGLPSQHTLLYGPPGTGKSSTAKALANRYADRGVRLVEVRKEDLHQLPAITAELRGRAPHFMLFVDDLSFEEHEIEYKALKALLEGAAEARPANVLIVATTNRRNLVRESFADRGMPSDDVHGRDTMQEKISLAARFGLRVTFAAPDQARYLLIATALARTRGLSVPDEEVRAQALSWERQHVGRSGRTARQFVDDLEARLGAVPRESAHNESEP